MIIMGTDYDQELGLFRPRPEVPDIACPSGFKDFISFGIQLKSAKPHHLTTNGKVSNLSQGKQKLNNYFQALTKKSKDENLNTEDKKNINKTFCMKNSNANSENLISDINLN